MEFWFGLSFVLLIPVVLVLAGALMAYLPPRHINGIYGYRTRRSMASQAAWDFAQRRGGLTWIALGVVLLPLSLAALLVWRAGEQVLIICVIVQMVCLVGSIIPTEIALRRRFDRQGCPL